LVQRYESISIEQDNFLFCVAQLVNRNALLKDQVERLKIENLAFQEKHDMLLYSHKNLMDDHIMLNIAHEVVIENNLTHAHVFKLKLYHHVLMLVARQQVIPPLS
jgi:uncharacterized small protein (DUF1192 family)